MSASKQYCSFHVGDLFLGVDVRLVQEMIRRQEMTAVPLAPIEMAGLINLRGQIVPAIDLRKRLGWDVGGDQACAMNVVVRTSDGVVSFLVDEIGDVLEVQSTQIERSPETLTGEMRELVAGVVQLKERLLLILDAEKAATLCPAV